MFVLDNIPRRMQLNRDLNIYFRDFGVFDQRVDAPTPSDLDYLYLTVALSNGLYHSIVTSDRLGFWFGMLRFENNMDFIRRMLIRRGIAVYANHVFKRLMFKMKILRLQKEDTFLLNELIEHSRLTWKPFFDSLERYIGNFSGC